jgi:hypothetical protein
MNKLILKAVMMNNVAVEINVPETIFSADNIILLYQNVLPLN